MNIAFAYNVKHNQEYSTEATQDDLEFDSEYVINSISNAIESLGHKVVKIEANLDAFQKLREQKENIDLVFNIAEGLNGDARESQIPIFCEMLGIPYTHSSPTTHAIKLNKQMTKDLLENAGVVVPHAQVFRTINDPLNPKLKYPFIVKPNKQGSSKGIFNDSVVHDLNSLKKAVERVLKEFDNEALVEEYIDGREFTVALLGNPPKMLPPIEQKFDFLPAGFNKVAGYELKWIYEDALKDLTVAYDCPPNVSKEIMDLIESTSLCVWNTLDVKDCARIDYRLNDENTLYFIEINTLPGINPDPNGLSYFPTAASHAGLDFNQLVDGIINSARSRYNI